MKEQHRIATPEQRKDRASKGGQAAQAKLTPEERSRRAKLRWQRRQLATLEAENETLRERVREFEERYAAASQESIMFRGDSNKSAKESEMFRRMHLQICEVAQERAEKIKALEAQLAQAQKPAAKSLADMIEESTTLAMDQRTAALETMIREFLKQTGAKVEDCVLVEQMEDTKLTWHIEHRPAPAGLPKKGER